MSDVRENKPSWHGFKIWRCVLCVFLALLIFALAFFIGFAVRYYTEDSSVRTLRWVKDMVRSKYYRDIDEEVLSHATLSDLFGTDGKTPLLDIYSAYYTKEAFSAHVDSMAGNQSGVGISVQSQDGVTRLFRVVGNSPAEESGLKTGMYLLGYGKDESDVIPYESAAFSAFLGRLDEDEPFTLCAAESGEDDGAYYTVFKTHYAQNYVFYADSAESYRFTGENADTLTQGETYLSDLPSDAAYIRLDSFEGNAARQFRNMLDVYKARGKNRLVLDLRNNGGGQVTILCEIAQYLCKNAVADKFPVTVARYKDGAESVGYAEKRYYERYFSSDSQIFVLANENTASASEALLGAMLDYGTVEYGDIFLSEINGVARTYGKGIMQQYYSNFLTGEAVKLTCASVQWPVSRNCIQARGILSADGAVPMPEENAVDCRHTALHTFIADYLA